MCQTVNHTSDNVPPNGVRLKVCIVDVEVQPVQSVSDTHTQNCLPKIATIRSKDEGLRVEPKMSR